MNVLTKYNVGDNVCTIDKATLKVRNFEIDQIFVTSTETGTEIQYHAKGDSSYTGTYPEAHCFGTTRELITYISE